MSKRSIQRDTKARNTGQGALGMGGQPDDDPRDLEGGGEGRSHDDRGGGTGPVRGASGSGQGVGSGGGSAGTETVGPSGDRGITGDIDAAARAARQPRQGPLVTVGEYRVSGVARFDLCHRCLARRDQLAVSHSGDLAPRTRWHPSRPGRPRTAAPGLDPSIHLTALEFSDGGIAGSETSCRTSPDLCASPVSVARSPSDTIPTRRLSRLRTTSRRTCRSCIVLAASSMSWSSKTKAISSVITWRTGVVFGSFPSATAHGDVAVGDHAGQSVVIAADRQWADFQVAHLPRRLLECGVGPDAFGVPGHDVFELHCCAPVVGRFLESRGARFVLA